jgi:hypothetical protein
VNSKIYAIPEFRNNYQSVIINRTRFFLRDDHAANLVEQRRAVWCRMDDVNCLSKALATHRYVTSVTRSDDVAFLAKGRVLMVNDQ